jgi:uncharacterized protein YciI
MRIRRHPAFVLALLAATGAAGAVRAQVPAGSDIPRNIKPYFMVFLVESAHPEGPPPAELRKRHLAYIRAETEAGRYMLAGPFQDHGRIAGIIIVNVPTADEARRIAEADPLVQSGRLAVEVHPMMAADLSGVRPDYAPR